MNDKYALGYSGKVDDYKELASIDKKHSSADSDDYRVMTGLAHGHPEDVKRKGVQEVRLARFVRMDKATGNSAAESRYRPTDRYVCSEVVNATSIYCNASAALA